MWPQSVRSLGSVLRARLTVYDAASGAVVHNDEMAADAAADLFAAIDQAADRAGIAVSRALKRGRDVARSGAAPVFD